jgi:hypothetical protein
MTPKIGISRSMTLPATVTRYQYPNPAEYHRPRTSSMTNRPLIGEDFLPF